ncbi:MAG: PfkB family carbohydrate kinase [Planctomycetota bacterium]|jgi:ribokinase
MPGRIPKVVVIGPAYVDMAIKCGEVPQPGQTVEGSGFSCTPTGAGPNRAIEAALCGCETYLLSKVGDDLFGQMLKTKLISSGVKTDFVYTAQAKNTGIFVTMVDSIGGNSSCVCAGANRALRSDEVACASAEQLIGSADVCLIHGDVPREVVTAAIMTANLYKTKVVLEAKLTIKNEPEQHERDWPLEYYSVNVLIPDFGLSAGGAELGAGTIHKIKLIGSELVAEGIECVAINTGPRGTFVVDREGIYHIDGFGLDIVDHNGSADAFAGALAASCGAGDKAKEAVRFAAAAGALACARFGSLDALPAKEDIIELLQKQPD